MNRYFAAASTVLLAGLAAAAGSPRPAAPRPEEKPPMLRPGLGNHHHAIRTTSEEAQKFFDQGIAELFDFNFEEAARSFGRCAELDPAAPMCRWGVAMGLGPNINVPMTHASSKAAFAEAQKAVALAKADGVPEIERDYAAAVATRYSDAPYAQLHKFEEAYARAMGDLSKKYPDDLDAATFYAESLMDLRPWKLWTNDGDPAPRTLEIVAVLESVLARDPLHPGANHFYIHTVEASPHPEWALASAMRLAALEPAAGHLVHMPGHIFMRTGDYDAAARTNVAAIAGDEAYIALTGVQSGYSVMSDAHNRHFLAVARAMEGRFADAYAAAQGLVAHLDRNKMPGMPAPQDWMTMPMQVLVRFHRWKEILALPTPDANLKTLTCFYHYGRGMALAATGDAAGAEKESAALDAAYAQLPAGASFGLNSANDVLDIVRDILTGQVMWAKKNVNEAYGGWLRAMRKQHELAYDEPPPLAPSSEIVGAALLRGGFPDQAETVFRGELKRNPRNGRALFGLWQALLAQKKTTDAALIKQQFDAAWAHADTPLSLDDF